MDWQALAPFIGGLIIGNILGLMTRGYREFRKGFSKGSDILKEVQAKGFTLNIKSREVLDALMKHPKIGIKGSTRMDTKTGVTIDLDGVNSIIEDLDGTQVTTRKDGTITVRRDP